MLTSGLDPGYLNTYGEGVCCGEGGRGGGVECRWHDKNGVSCERDEYESSLIVGGRGGGGE